MKDPLLHKLEEIREEATAAGLNIFFLDDYPSHEEIYSVSWDAEHGGGWKGFLMCAKAAGSILYLNWRPFEQRNVDEALTSFQAKIDRQELLAESDKADLVSRSKRIDKYREKVGLTATIYLAFLAESIVHDYEITAEWFDDFEELTAVDEEQLDGVQQEERIDKGLVDKWANELATHPKFSSCKNDDQRELVLEALAGEKLKDLPLDAILHRADAIYVVRVKPLEEERIRKQARELRDQGLTLNAIAEALHITRDRVSGILAEPTPKRHP